MNRLHPELFDGIEWSSNRAPAQTLDAANASRVQTLLLDAWRDIDQSVDLRRLLQNSANAVATRTRARVLQHSAHR